MYNANINVVVSDPWRTYNSKSIIYVSALIPNTQDSASNLKISPYPWNILYNQTIKYISYLIRGAHATVRL